MYKVTESAVKWRWVSCGKVPRILYLTLDGGRGPDLCSGHFSHNYPVSIDMKMNKQKKKKKQNKNQYGCDFEVENPCLKQD